MTNSDQIMLSRVKSIDDSLRKIADKFDKKFLTKNYFDKIDTVLYELLANLKDDNLSDIVRAIIDTHTVVLESHDIYSGNESILSDFDPSNLSLDGAVSELASIAKISMDKYLNEE